MLIASFAAVATPTLIRAGVGGPQGDGFCPYLPFVMLAAMSLNWRAAAAVAAVSGLLADLLFEGTRYRLFEKPCEITGLIYFGVASALMIGLAQAFRKAVADPLWLNGPAKAPKRLVFSLKDGQACASWYGGRSFVPLGPADEVEKLMQQFLAQREVGRRLSGD